MVNLSDTRSQADLFASKSGSGDNGLGKTAFDGHVTALGEELYQHVSYILRINSTPRITHSAQLGWVDSRGNDVSTDLVWDKVGGQLLDNVVNSGLGSTVCEATGRDSVVCTNGTSGDELRLDALGLGGALVAGVSGIQERQESNGGVDHAGDVDVVHLSELLLGGLPEELLELSNRDLTVLGETTEGWADNTRVGNDDVDEADLSLDLVGGLLEVGLGGDISDDGNDRAVDLLSIST
jgi:hypothetical protein